MIAERLQINAGIAGQTLAAIVRSANPGTTWSQARKQIAGRRLRLNGELCLDPARRVKEGDVVELLNRPAPLPTALAGQLTIRRLDEHLVVVEKPAGISTTRHPAEMHWPAARRRLTPTLDERVQAAIAEGLKVPLHRLPRLRKVHRLDKLTSGLLVFARSAAAERDLGRQFFAHTVRRCYQALVAGRPKVGTIRTYLLRDRGDGRRGSSGVDGRGKLAVTHIEKVESLGKFSLITCRLETGRTHQIRIHLAELGHPVCGDPVYSIRPDGTRIADVSGVERLALHAAELGFRHPATNEELHWIMPLPPDLNSVIDRLRRADG